MKVSFNRFCFLNRSGPCWGDDTRFSLVLYSPYTKDVLADLQQLHLDNRLEHRLLRKKLSMHVFLHFFIFEIGLIVDTSWRILFPHSIESQSSPVEIDNGFELFTIRIFLLLKAVLFGFVGCSKCALDLCARYLNNLD